MKPDCYPPFYPNGWLPVLESRALKKNKILPIIFRGEELVAFRGYSGKVCVVSAYCPHLGAHFGYGGDVIDDCIKCPFHGWLFNKEGECTYAPGLTSMLIIKKGWNVHALFYITFLVANIPRATLKVWNSIEINGSVFIWNHANGEEPHWFPPVVPGFESYTLQHRCEHRINCHIQVFSQNDS